MTTAPARQKARSAGGSRGQEDNRSERPDATNPIAVLIRLPDLSEPASKEKTPDMANGLVEPDDMAIVQAESSVQPPVSEEPIDQATEAAVLSTDEEPDAGPPEEEPKATEAAAQRVVTMPRPVMQLAGVLALIAIVIAAYFAIVGGEGSIVDEDESKLAADQAHDAWPGPSPSTEPTEPADIALSPPLENDQQQELFVDSSTSQSDPVFLEPADTRGAEATAEASTMGPEQTGMLDLPLGEDADRADSLSGSDSWMHDDRLEGFGVDVSHRQKETEETEETDVRVQPEAPSDGIAQVPETLPLERTVDTSPHGYPVTDPSTYQYPEDYHTKFQAFQDSSSLQGALRRPSERSIYSEAPGTARLRPPIEPPPVRR